MLYRLDRHWKMIFFMLGCWIGYGICGFEFTVVALLSVLALKSIMK